MSSTTVEENIRHKLMIGLQPVRLDVINDSHRHAGHASSPGTGNSHFEVLIVSSKFEGTSRVERHRIINKILAEEIAGPIHALSLKAYAPSEPIS